MPRQNEHDDRIYTRRSHPAHPEEQARWQADNRRHPIPLGTTAKTAARDRSRVDQSMACRFNCTFASARAALE